MWKRNCPKCGTEHSYTRRFSMISAERNGRVCNHCARAGKHHSEETIQKIRISNGGENNPMFGKPGTMLGKSGPFKGKHHSIETKRKMRLSAIQSIKESKGGCVPRYNPTACRLIEEYGRKHGYHFQHAENGGEFFIDGLGYWVDGYDKKKNAVIEYYERAHQRTKKRDENRKKEIVRHLGCKFIELREWNEE